MSPAKLLLEFDQRNHVDDLAEFVKAYADADSNLNVSDISNLNNQDLAFQATRQVRKYNKCYKDKAVKKLTTYQSGDNILIKDTRVKPGENAKLKSKYKGPYAVIKSLGNNRYIIQDIPEFNLSLRPMQSCPVIR